MRTNFAPKLKQAFDKQKDTQNITAIYILSKKPVTYEVAGKYVQIALVKHQETLVIACCLNFEAALQISNSRLCQPSVMPDQDIESISQAHQTHKEIERLESAFEEQRPTTTVTKKLKTSSKLIQHEFQC